jgi:hypothetical protein
MWNRIGDAILITILTGILAFLGSAFLTYLLDDNAHAKIGNVSKIGEAQYVVPINIITYKETAKDIYIGIPTAITEKQLSVNKPVDIQLIKSNIEEKSGTVIKIKEIPQNFSIQLIISTKNAINDSDIEVRGKNLLSERISEAESPLMSQLKTLALSAVLYALIIGGTSYLVNKKAETRVALVKEQQLELKEQLKRSDMLLESTEKDTIAIRESIKHYEDKLTKYQNDSVKKQILLQAKLNDYRKELNFWRNTIRKILYKIPFEEKKVDDLIESISQSLKTYQTNEKNEHDFETIKVLSKMIKDIDNEK